MAVGRSNFDEFSDPFLLQFKATEKNTFLVINLNAIFKELKNIPSLKINQLTKNEVRCSKNRQTHLK